MCDDFEGQCTYLPFSGLPLLFVQVLPPRDAPVDPIVQGKELDPQRMCTNTISEKVKSLQSVKFLVVRFVSHLI